MPPDTACTLPNTTVGHHLNCPSRSPTLRPWIAANRVCTPGRSRPAWRGSGAHISTNRPKIGKLKLLDALQGPFPARYAKMLSLSGGASNRSIASPRQASPLLFAFLHRLRNDEGDPLGRPRESRYAASFLAHAPHNEGELRAGQVERGRSAGAGRDPPGLCGLGREHRGGDRVHRVSKLSGVAHDSEPNTRLQEIRRLISRGGGRSTEIITTGQFRATAIALVCEVPLST
jgi:hypothetical protein